MYFIGLSARVGRSAEHLSGAAIVIDDTGCACRGGDHVVVAGHAPGVDEGKQGMDGLFTICLLEFKAY